MLCDVRLIWANCRTFNEAESDVCIAADELEALWDKLWRQNGLERLVRQCYLLLFVVVVVAGFRTRKFQDL